MNFNAHHYGDKYWHKVLIKAKVWRLCKQIILLYTLTVNLVCFSSEREVQWSVKLKKPIIERDLLYMIKCNFQRNRTMQFSKQSAEIVLKIALCTGITRITTEINFMILFQQKYSNRLNITILIRSKLM